MIEPNKPIIDTRYIINGEQTPNATPPPSSEPTPTPTAAESSPVATKESSTETPATATGQLVKQVPAQFKANNYDEVIKILQQRMQEFKPMSAEALEKLRRRQRREGIISSISDTARSIANIIAVHNYAPNMYDPTTGMSARAKARFDRDKAEREAEEEKYLNYAMTVGRLKDSENERGLQIWKLEHGLEREEFQDQLREAAEERAQAKADRDAAMAQLRMELLQGKIDEQTANARAAEIEAEYAKAFWQSRINKNNRVPVRGTGGKSKGGRPGEYPYYDSNGKLHYAHSYEAMRQNAIQNGTWHEGTQTSTSERTGITGKTTTTTTKTGKGHSSAPNTKKKTGVNWKN